MNSGSRCVYLYNSVLIALRRLISLLIWASSSRNLQKPMKELNFKNKCRLLPVVIPVGNAEVCDFLVTSGLRMCLFSSRLVNVDSLV